jgi:hypothetical protein
MAPYKRFTTEVTEDTQRKLRGPINKEPSSLTEALFSVLSVPSVVDL